MPRALSRLITGLITWLSFGCSKKPQPPEPMAPGEAPSDARVEVPAGDEVVMNLPQIAFKPPSGWLPFPTGTKDQKPEDVRIASPALMDSAGGMTLRFRP